MSSDDPRIGASYGSYRLERRLGEGGMGTVYVGIHARTGRRYAVKLLHPQTQPARLEKQSLARFRREARALSELRHASVVAIHDFDVTELGEPYLVMDLLEGEPLASRIDRGHGLPWDEAIAYFHQLASALSALHEAGIVHRDVKPVNVLLSRIPGGAERAVLVDFGLAKEIVSEASTVTAPDTALGTPAYMAPEQARGQGVDHRTDVYALGIVLYEMLAGRPPFVGPTPTAVIAQTLVDPPPPLTSMTHTPLPPGIDVVIARALAKDPVERYASVDELEGAIRALSPDSDAANVPQTRAMPVSGASTASTGAATAREASSTRRAPAPIAAAAIGVVVLAAVVLGAWGSRRAPSDAAPAAPVAAAPETGSREPAAPAVLAGADPAAAPPPPVAAPELVPASDAPLAPTAPAAPPAAELASPSEAPPGAPSPARAARRARVPPVAATSGSRSSAPSPPPPSTPATNPPAAPPPVAPRSPVGADPLARARDAASRREWSACVAALASQATIDRDALEVFLICADHARDRSALERGCREVDRLLLFDHPWHRRCQVEILGGGQLPRTSPPPTLRGDDLAEHDAEQLRQRGDFAGCARALESVQRSYSGLMMRLDCAELSRDPALLRRACRRYIDARIPAQTRFNPLCEDVLRSAAEP